MSKLSLDTTLTPEHLADIKRGKGVHARAQEAVHESGLSMGGSPDARPYRPMALWENPRKVGPRWPFACMRIRRILEGVARSSSITDAVGGAEYKKLAREYGETYAYYLTRDRPAPARRVDHNPFRGLSDHDAFRMFVRKVEDICDRSTGKLGSWYTK